MQCYSPVAFDSTNCEAFFLLQSQSLISPGFLHRCGKSRTRKFASSLTQETTLIKWREATVVVCFPTIDELRGEREREGGGRRELEPLPAKCYKSSRGIITFRSFSSFFLSPRNERVERSRAEKLVICIYVCEVGNLINNG